MNTNKVLCTFILVVFSHFKVEAQQSYKTLIFEGNKAYKNKKYDLAATKFSEAAKLKEIVPVRTLIEELSAGLG